MKIVDGFLIIYTMAVPMGHVKAIKAITLLVREMI